MPVKPSFALVERLVRVAECMPDLPDVHRPAQDCCRPGEQPRGPLDRFGLPLG